MKEEITIRLEISISAKTTKARNYLSSQMLLKNGCQKEMSTYGSSRTVKSLKMSLRP